MPLTARLAPDYESLSREPTNLSSQLARFTDRCVDLSRDTVIGDPAPSVKRGDDGYADWEIVALHCLRKYLDPVGTRNQDLEMRIWRVLLRLTARPHELGEVQAVNSTSLAQRTSSHDYTKRIKDTFESVKRRSWSIVIAGRSSM